MNFFKNAWGTIVGVSQVAKLGLILPMVIVLIKDIKAFREDTEKLVYKYIDMVRETLDASVKADILSWFSKLDKITEDTADIAIKFPFMKKTERFLRNVVDMDWLKKRIK